ncbi:hypothetical protein GCM10009854_14370 [Saccharopolyspora halophila]|uniref:WXG100 family type VII secretion target n=2 Tax=Saccharopolyspora halophila TaxID=405551 RepID=A0ABN3FWK8_9PSEU
MGGFRNDFTRLTEHAGEFADHASHARRIAATLREAVESAGACWGDDEIGERFSATHRGPAEAALAAVEELPERLREVGDEFAATAETSRRTDSANAAELDRLADRGE